MDVGKVAKDANLALLLGLFLFEGHEDWTAGNYDQFVKPAVARGNVGGILIGNENPQMIDTITEFLRRAKAGFSQVPVGTSQTTGFWLADGRAAQVLPLVDFIGVNIYPAWDWTRADANNQPIGVTPEAGFNSFRDTYAQIQAKYPGRQIVVTETGWPNTFDPIQSQTFPVGISNPRDYLNRVIAWAHATTGHGFRLRLPNAKPVTLRSDCEWREATDKAAYRSTSRPRLKAAALAPARLLVGRAIIATE